MALRKERPLASALDILLDEENGIFFLPNDHKALTEKIFQSLEFGFYNMREPI